MKATIRLLSGKDPALPQVGFGSADVRDVAAAHVGAIDNLDTHGLRILVVERFRWFADIAHAIADAFPDRKIVTLLASVYSPSIFSPYMDFEERRLASTPMAGRRPVELIDPVLVLSISRLELQPIGIAMGNNLTRRALVTTGLAFHPWHLRRKVNKPIWFSVNGVLPAHWGAIVLAAQMGGQTQTDNRDQHAEPDRRKISPDLRPGK